MALFLLALIIFGVAARANARANPADIPGDDEDGYDVDVNLYEVCHWTFTYNELTYDVGFFKFLIKNICPLLFGDDEEGSGEESSYWPGNGPEILTFQDLVQALSSNPIDQQLLRAMAKSTCKPEGQGQRVDSFCRFYRDGITVSGVDGGSVSGSDDGSGDGSGDGGYGFSVYWSSMVDGGNFW